MKKLFSWILKLSISSGILYYIFTIIPISEVVTSIASAKVSYIIIALLIVVVTHYIVACRMKVLTDKQGMSLSIRHIFEISFMTSFYGLFLPGSLTAGAIRWYKLSRPDNKWMEALASILYGRLINIIILAILGVSFWAFDMPTESNDMIGLSLLAILCGLLITYFLIFRGKAFYFLQKSMAQVNLPLVPTVFRNKITRFLISTRQYHNLSRNSLIYIVGLTLTSHLLGILVFYLFALSLEINISFVTVGWVRSCVLFIAMLPVSFSGLGVREGTLIILLQPYGVLSTDIVALSFLLFVRILLVGGIGGLFEARNLFLPNRDKSKAKEQIAT